MNFNKFQQICTNFKSKREAFTLLELLIYSGILVITTGLIGGVVYTISRANLKTKVEEELNNQMMILEETLRQNVHAANKVNNISGSLLSLEMGEASASPSVFSLEEQTVILQKGEGNKLKLNNKDKVKVISLSFLPTGPIAVSISGLGTYHYAWSENVGWIDFAYSGGNVQVPRGAGELKGMAYILADKSWISLNCLTTNSCNDSSYKVISDENGNLSGWAWSENYGWISVSCVTGGANGGNICNTSDYKVTINEDTGEFDGYAWSDNIGWISFNCKTGGESKTDICAISDYKVQDLRLDTSAIKVDITLEYNSPKPELQIKKENSFVFNMVAKERF